MERLELKEANKKEITRRVVRWSFQELERLANAATTAAGGVASLTDGDTASAVSEMKGVADQVLAEERVVLTWDEATLSWWITTATRMDASTIDALSDDYPTYF